MRAFVICYSLFVISGAAYAQLPAAQQPAKPFEPVSGQAGKDVVWVPSPPDMVNKLMELGQVTSKDVVIDLGSGDGRNVIAAAKLGAQALGVEYNPDMVALSRRRAAEAGVAEKALFVQGDMYEADISKASVMALFLLPDNMNKLLPRFLALKPGSRIVSNTFSMEGWTADHTETLPDCSAWCTVLLWVVPANAAGAWQLPQGTLTLKQEFQHVAGTLGTTAIADGRLNGEQITFTAGTARYAGRVNGDVIDGTVTTGTETAAWRATRGATPTGPSRE